MAPLNAHQLREIAPLLISIQSATDGAACSSIPVSEPTSEKPSSAAVTHKPAAPIAIVGRSPIMPPATPATSCPHRTLARRTKRRLALTRPSIGMGLDGLYNPDALVKLHV